MLLIASWWFIAQADRSLWLLAIGAVLLEFAVQAVHVTSQNLIVATMPHSSSRAIGAYMICYSLGSALGAVTTTTLYQHARWPAAAALGACYAAAALSIWALDRLFGGATPPGHNDSVSCLKPGWRQIRPSATKLRRTASRVCGSCTRSTNSSGDSPHSFRSTGDSLSSS